MTSENEWIVDGVAQFLRSALWTTPVHNFIDEHCILFTGVTTGASGPTSEQSVEHKVIHEKFRALADDLLTGYIEELGVAPEVVLETCEKSSNPDGVRFIEYVNALDKYETFVLLMAKRNAELEAEMLRQLHRLSRSGLAGAGSEAESHQHTDDATAAANANAHDDDDEEDEDLKAAIAASLADAEGAKNRVAAAEDEELQRALQLSLAMEEQRKQRELDRLREQSEARRQQEETEAAALAAAAQMMEAAEATAQSAAARERKRREEEAARIAAIEKEHADRRAAIESTVHHARVENYEHRSQQPAAPALKPAASVPGDMSPLPTKSPEHGGGTVAPAPPAAPAATDAAAAAGSEPLSGSSSNNTSTKVLPGLGSLARGRGGNFSSFAKLPSIGGGTAMQPGAGAAPSFEELKAQLDAKKRGESGGAAAAPTAATASAVSAPPQQSEEEIIKQRAEYMRQQRLKLLEAKKQERNAQLDEFVQKQSTGNTPPPAGATDAKSPSKVSDEAHQDLTRQLARRFRTDIATEASKK